ncbi:MAG: hypothetical protein HYU66_22795 [Armatimonadetes bacterium]|nr:hypothetical protein [Armatimonadota bacterium]
MAALHLEPLPDDLLRWLEDRASANRSSASSEAVALLEQARHGEEGRRRHAAALERLRAARLALPDGAPDSVELVREGRQR